MFKKEDERRGRLPVSELLCDYVARCVNSLLISPWEPKAWIDVLTVGVATHAF